MKVNFNNNASEFNPIQQMLARRALEAQLAKSDGESGDNAIKNAGTSDRNTLVQLIAAENMLAAASEIPDFESAQSVAEVSRGEIISRAADMVRGQSNITPDDVLKLLE